MPQWLVMYHDSRQNFRSLLMANLLNP